MEGSRTRAIGGQRTTEQLRSHGSPPGGKENVNPAYEISSINGYESDSDDVNPCPLEDIM